MIDDFFFVSFSGCTTNVKKKQVKTIPKKSREYNDLQLACDFFGKSWKIYYSSNPILLT